MQLFDHFAANLPFRKTMEMSGCKYVGGAVDNSDGALLTCRICQLYQDMFAFHQGWGVTVPSVPHVL